MPVATTIQVRRGTAAQWTATNPVLAVGEPGLITDTGVMKYGDGATAWNALPFAGPFVATAVKTADYTAVPNDYVLVNATAASRTVTLPTAPVTQTRIGVKMVAVAGTNTTSIAAGGSDHFNLPTGPTSLTLSKVNQAMILQYVASTATWTVQADDLPLGAVAEATTVVGGGVARVNEGPLSLLDPRVAMVADGTDQTAKMNTALGLLTSGGVIFVPPVTAFGGVPRIDGQITVPNDAASVPDQPSIRITGTGASHNGRNGVPNGGSILDLRYAGSGAKIQSFGTGLLELDHIVLKDGGSGSSPFVMVTNTTLQAHHMQVHGNKNGQACDQDAFILGGTSTTADGTVNSPFQGYGTAIENNYFNHIRRGVYGRTYCNGTVFSKNTFWQSCGAAAGIGAVEFVGLSTNATTGNLIFGNLIEMVAYSWGIYFNDYASGNLAIANGFYDPNLPPLAYHRCNATAGNNFIIPGPIPGAIPAVDDQSASSTIPTGQSGKQSEFSQGIKTNIWRVAPNLAMNIQPTAAQSSDSNVLLSIVRAAAEANNPGTQVLELRQSAQLLLSGTAPAINFFNQGAATQVGTVSHTGVTRSGSGGAITLDSGTGGSSVKAKGFDFEVTSYIDNSVQFQVGTSGIGFYGGAKTAKQTVTGSRGSNAALASLLTALAAVGLLTDSSTA